MRIQAPTSDEPIASMPWDQFLGAGAGLALAFTLLWALLGREGRSSWADFAWAVAIGLCAALFCALSEGWTARRVAVAALGLAAVLYAFRSADVTPAAPAPDGRCPN